MSVEKISLRRCSSMRVARVDIISGASLMRECRDRRMFTPGRVGSSPCAFIVVRGRRPGAFLRVCGGVRIPPFRSAGGSYRQPGVGRCGAEGRTIPNPFGLGIVATSGQSITTSSNVSCPVMIPRGQRGVSTTRSAVMTNPWPKQREWFKYGSEDRSGSGASDESSDRDPVRPVEMGRRRMPRRRLRRSIASCVSSFAPQPRLPSCLR